MIAHDGRASIREFTYFGPRAGACRLRPASSPASIAGGKCRKVHQPSCAVAPVRGVVEVVVAEQVTQRIPW
ncbi:MAG: hypothetical protein ACRDJP_03830 [Actinomycetota bacterium]